MSDAGLIDPVRRFRRRPPPIGPICHGEAIAPAGYLDARELGAGGHTPDVTVPVAATGAAVPFPRGLPETPLQLRYQRCYVFPRPLYGAFFRTYQIRSRSDKRAGLMGR